MKSIAQIAHYRQSLILYAEKHGVTKAARKYKVNRQYIYRWRNRYDGTLTSLYDRSHRPHGHPNQHTEEELTLIRNMRKRNPNTGIVVLWVKLRQRGYTRSISGLYRVLIRSGQMAVKLPNPKYVPKPYEQMLYPGQRVQIDVKHVPSACLVGEAKGKKFYQYSFIDEYSRFRYLEAFDEISTYSSAAFLRHCAEKFPYVIECVQTDNGPEFTNRLNSNTTNRLTLFEKTCQELGIFHKLIKPYTPRHNGKVERSHRKDNEEFYASHSFYSFDDFKSQLAVRQRQYNNFPMRPLLWHSPKDTLFSFPLFVTYH